MTQGLRKDNVDFKKLFSFWPCVSVKLLGSAPNNSQRCVRLIECNGFVRVSIPQLHHVNQKKVNFVEVFEQSSSIIDAFFQRQLASHP